MERNPLIYTCLWCKKKLWKLMSSETNLNSHLDCTKQQGSKGVGCPNRSLNISAGNKLPPSEDQRAYVEKSGQKGTQDKIIKTSSSGPELFDKPFFNQVIGLWKTHPWNYVASNWGSSPETCFHTFTSWSLTPRMNMGKNTWFPYHPALTGDCYERTWCNIFSHIVASID